MKTLLTSCLLFISPLAFAAGPPPMRTILWDVMIVVGIALVFGLLDLLVRKAPWIDADVKIGVRYALLVILVLYIIYLILGFLGL